MAFSIVQSNVATGTGGLSCAFPQANTAGNSLIVVVGEATATDTFSVSDNAGGGAGNTYISLATVNPAATPSQWQVFYCLSCIGGSNTVTMSCAGSATSVIYIHEFPSLLSKDTANSATGTTFSPDSGSITPATSQELAFGYTGMRGSGITDISFAAGWNSPRKSVGAAFASSTAWQQISSAIDLTATIAHGKSATAFWAAQVVAFVIPVAPPPSIPPPIGNTFDSLSATTLTSFSGEKESKKSLPLIVIGDNIRP